MSINGCSKPINFHPKILWFYIECHQCIYIPTNVILGVAAFLTTGAGLPLAAVAAGPAAGVVFVVVAAAEAAAAAATFTGSVDGIGLPSLVCSFRTYKGKVTFVKSSFL